ncbi:hypothetical protein BY996DRAFT_6579864 [Phakopsora pachyrhizi]|nr:hypothetical protein BY996DRAFT_6579864 [Phakopsora pachyrhizi]
MALLPSNPVVNSGTSKIYSLRTRSQSPPKPILNSPFHTRGSSTRSSSVDASFPNDRSYLPSPRSSSSLLDELNSEKLKNLYQSPFLNDGLIASSSFQSMGKKADEQDQKSKFGEDLKKEHKKASKWKDKAAERLKVLRSLIKEAECDLFYLVSRKNSMSRRTFVTAQDIQDMKNVGEGSVDCKVKDLSKEAFKASEIIEQSRLMARERNRAIVSSGDCLVPMSQLSQTVIQISIVERHGFKDGKELKLPQPEGWRANLFLEAYLRYGQVTLSIEVMEIEDRASLYELFG